MTKRKTKRGSTSSQPSALCKTTAMEHSRVVEFKQEYTIEINRIIDIFF